MRLLIIIGLLAAIWASLAVTNQRLQAIQTQATMANCIALAKEGQKCSALERK